VAGESNQEIRRGGSERGIVDGGARSEIVRLCAAKMKLSIGVFINPLMRIGNFQGRPLIQG